MRLSSNSARGDGAHRRRKEAVPPFTKQRNRLKFVVIEVLRD